VEVDVAGRVGIVWATPPEDIDPVLTPPAPLCDEFGRSEATKPASELFRVLLEVSIQAPEATKDL